MKKCKGLLAGVLTLALMCSNVEPVMAAEKPMDNIVETVAENPAGGRILDADGNIASGTFKGMDWVIDGEGMLTISGAYDKENAQSEDPTWLEYSASIVSAKVIATDVEITRDWFRDCENIKSIDLKEFDTSNVTSMSGMFRGCSSLTDLDVSSFHTSKVEAMSQMFYGCSRLSNLDVSGWDTANVSKMYEMFVFCPELVSLDVSRFNTENVTSMASMFLGCSKLTTLDVSGFDTHEVTRTESSGRKRKPSNSRLRNL